MSSTDYLTDHFQQGEVTRIARSLLLQILWKLLRNFVDTLGGKHIGRNAESAWNSSLVSSWTTATLYSPLQKKEAIFEGKKLKFTKMLSPFYIAFVQGMNINFTDVFPLWGLIACDVIYIKYSWQSFPVTGALLEEINFSVFVIKVLRCGDNVAVGDQGSRVVGEDWIDLPSLIYSSEILVYHDFHQNFFMLNVQVETSRKLFISRIASAWNFKATSQLKVWAFWSGGIPQYFSLFFSSSDALSQWGLNK